MIAPVDTSDRHVRIDPSELFWAALDAESVRTALRASSSANRNTTLGHLFDESLPVPVEDVHAIYTRTPSGSVIACAIPRSKIQDHLDAGALTLIPTRLPDWIDAEIDTGSLNLLTTPYEPAPVKRARRRWAIHSTVLLLVLLAVLVVGFEMRRVSWQRGTDSIARTEQQIYKEILPPGPNAQPDALRLTAELRRLRQTRTGPEHALLPPRADDRLALLLANWPASPDTRAELITVAPESISCQAITPDAETAASLAASLAESLGGLPGWRARQPQIRSQRETIRTTIRLDPLEHEASP